MLVPCSHFSRCSAFRRVSVSSSSFAASAVPSTAVEGSSRYRTGAKSISQGHTHIGSSPCGSLSKTTCVFSQGSSPFFTFETRPSQYSAPRSPIKMPTFSGFARTGCVSVLTSEASPGVACLAFSVLTSVLGVCICASTSSTRASSFAISASEVSSSSPSPSPPPKTPSARAACGGRSTSGKMFIASAPYAFGSAPVVRSSNNI
mmetsp:Transcript_9509/g.35370  ORF Transcript_9509/g.35370 Transcript_9509/m.35370 type:complete len:204 (+) Transcript_9509:820-1431(+)